MIALQHAPKTWFLTLAVLVAFCGDSPGQATIPSTKRTETAELPDCTKVVGRLTAGRSGVVQFVPDGGAAPLDLDRIGRILAEGDTSKTSGGPAAFHVLLGLNQRISGRLISIDASTVKLETVVGKNLLTIDRKGIAGVVQRTGEVQVLQDGFEALDANRWSRTGAPDIKGERTLSGRGALVLPAGGSSITTRLPAPFASGRVEIAFWDDAQKVAGQKWFIDLTFRKPDSELATLRVVPGWADETLAVETPGGPALTVQALARKPGWHRLSARFESERVSLDLDGDDLAHGRGLRGKLVEFRVATETIGAAQPPAALSAILDDLRIVRMVEPSGRFETDLKQDEIRLASGDQLFGEVDAADGEQIQFRLDGGPARSTWADVSGFYPKRQAATSSRFSGDWAEVEWRTASGNDPRDVDRVEGVISSINDDVLILEVPYVGKVTVPRLAITRVEPRGRASRAVIKSRSMHLGDRTSETLDPPQAQPAPVEIPFTVESLPQGDATLLIDASEVIGEEGSGEYIDLVKDGQLRTSLTVNGKTLDDLNHFVSSRSESPQRLRIPIPAGVLRTGPNVLRIDQSGSKSDAKLRDNLGIARITLEFSPEPKGEGR